MNRIEKGIIELKSAFKDAWYPPEFLEKYDQLECLAHSHGTETFLVSDKKGGSLYVAKCYDKLVYAETNEHAFLTGLRHDGLPAYASSFENSQVFVTVREYVKGTPLDLYAKENKLTEKQVVDLCVQLCDILGYLHGQEKPVIHRDIKPQNIIVRQDGHIALIDFDIARQYSDGAETDTQYFGTRVYAPPEQYGFSQTDCRADIYSLGVLLRFLLTGSEKGRPDKPLSKPMKRIVGRCTAFSPDERFASAEAVKRALLLSDGRRRKKTAILLSFAVTALLFLCIGFAVGRFTAFLKPGTTGGTAAFKEPLIEAAARIQLGKTQGEPITALELETVHKLYIFGTEVAATRAPFENGLGDRDRYTRGGITTLDDLALMPNIEEMQISYQDLEDISGIAALKNPVSIILMHTWVSDVSALSGKQSLVSLNLYDTNVSDVSCLNACVRLEFLELGKSLVNSPDALGGFDSVTDLSLTGLKLATLEGIDRFTYLETLNLIDTEVGSADALKELPMLKKIRANGALYESLLEMFADTRVTVTNE